MPLIKPTHPAQPMNHPTARRLPGLECCHASS